jgi:hypothetical protein
MRNLVFVALIVALAPSFALDAKWTPNGEAPAPFSTNARQQMGIDPSAFAGQARGPPAVPPKGVGLQFNAGALLVMYLTNNWKVVIALQQIILKLLQPFIGAMDQRRDAQEKASKAATAEAARQARLSRLKSKALKKPTGDVRSSPGDDDDE